MNEFIIIINDKNSPKTISVELQKQRNSSSVGPFIRNKINVYNIQQSLCAEQIEFACHLKKQSPFLSFPITISSESSRDYYLNMAIEYGIKIYRKTSSHGSVKPISIHITNTYKKKFDSGRLERVIFYIKLQGGYFLLNPFYNVVNDSELYPLVDSCIFKTALSHSDKYESLMDIIDGHSGNPCWKMDVSLFIELQALLVELEKNESVICKFLIEGKENSQSKTTYINRVTDIDWLEASNDSILLSMEDEIISFYLKNRKYADLNLIFKNAESHDLVLDKPNNIDELLKNNQQPHQNICRQCFDVPVENLDHEILTSLLSKSGFIGQLKNHQKDGVIWLLKKYLGNKTGVLVSDEMGLGKTIQVLSLLAIVKNQKSKVLIICPASLKNNWFNEINKFYPTLSNEVSIIESADDCTNISIASYEQVRVNFNLFHKSDYDLLILDESQRIKNKNTKTWSVINEIFGDFRIVMTGTPIENSENDLLSAISFIMRNQLPMEWERIERNREYSSFGGEDKVKVITSFFKDVILSRKKIDHITLPSCTKSYDLIEMEPRLKIAYNEIKNLYLTIIAHNKGAYNFTKLDAMLRLRQLCSLPSSLRDVFPKHSLDFECTKFIFAKNRLLENIENGIDTILFTTFLDVIDAFEEFLIFNKISHSRIDGRVLGKKREAEIHSFVNNDECKVLLSTLHVGGVGLNLTNAKEIILYNSWWNPAIEEQAIARVHRIGLQHDVSVYIPIYKSSIEEKILVLLDKKKKLASVMDDQLLTDEDIMYLLN